MDCRGSAAPPRDDEWRFLLPRCDALSLYTHECDDTSDVRVVGDDEAAELWLGVALDREGGLRQIHEAVVLTHLMARARPDLWVEWFVVEERCVVAPWVIPKKHRIPFRYAFQFHETEHTDPAFLMWENSMDALFGGAEPSAEFVRDLARVEQLLKRDGVEVADLEPIPILLSTKPGRTESATMVLTNIKRLVDATRRLETGAEREGHGGRLAHHSRGTLFRVAALEIDVTDNFLKRPLFNVIRDVLQLGIDVECIGLPDLYQTALKIDEMVSIGDVGLFMRTLMGISPVSPNGRGVRVRRIKMPIRYLETMFFAPFCSALACARHLQVLYIKGSEASTKVLDNSTTLRRHVWSWLAFALFSSASTCSVERLVIDGMGIEPSDVDAIRTMVMSEDALATMFTHAHRQNGSDSGRHTVADDGDQDLSNSPGTTRATMAIQIQGHWTIHDGEFQRAFTATESIVVEADVMHHADDAVGNGREDGTSETCYVPGMGFRSSDRPPSTRSPKKRRVLTRHAPSRSSLHAFALTTTHSRPDGVAALHELLTLIGPQLRSLRIQVPHLDEVALDRVFVACPRLENFALADARLASMDAFLNAYRRHGLALSSLSLDGVSVPESTLQVFLRMLLQSNTIESTLRRLDLGANWPHELSNATIAIVRNILDHNKTLTHLHLHGSLPQCRLVRQLLDPYHGQLVEGLSYTERARRMATLGGLRRWAQKNPRLALDDDSKRLVVAFAAPSPIFRVVSWSSTLVGGPRDVDPDPFGW